MSGGEDSYAETPLQLASAAGRYSAALPSKGPQPPGAVPPLPLAGAVTRHLALNPLLWAPGGSPLPYPSAFLLSSTLRQGPAEGHSDVASGASSTRLVFQGTTSWSACC